MTQRIGDIEKLHHLPFVDLMTLTSGRFSREELFALIDEAVKNKRLSTDFLGAHTFSYRRITSKWVETFLYSQVRPHGTPLLTLWKGVRIQKAEFPELFLECLDKEAWLEFDMPYDTSFIFNGKALIPVKNGRFLRIEIQESGSLFITVLQCKK